MTINPIRLLQPRRFGDDRGWFSETFKEKELLGLGIDVHFVQDNHSLSRTVGTLRGIHFQRPPHAQDKLVRCVRGGIFDIAVDLRKGSSTYGKWVGAELTADNGRQLFVPVGFGHAFMTLEPDTEVIYKVTDYYAPECDGGVRWNDPDIAVAWPAAVETPQLSAKDAVLPFLKDFDSPFADDGAPLLQLDR
jgi:dTDP-4-dehydrorhamnose 3,5-epimerase